MRFVEPEKVVTHFHLKDGDQVADFGAGTGYFLKPLSRAVGQSGVVFACEIQRTLVETMHALVAKEHLSNVKPLWCDFEKREGSKITTGSLDVVLLINSLFQIENKPVVAEECARVLRPGGRVIVIDWTESWGGLGPEPKAVVPQVDAEAVFNAAGFTTETTFDAGDHHYGVSFRA